MITNPTYPSPFKRLPIDWLEVIYLEDDGNYTTFVFTDGTTRLTSKTIGVFEPLLPEQFVRIHKGCIVNRNFVVRFDKTRRCVLMVDNVEIKVARRRQKVVQKV